VSEIAMKILEKILENAKRDILIIKINEESNDEG
jgi:hypothetical protein